MSRRSLVRVVGGVRHGAQVIRQSCFARTHRQRETAYGSRGRVARAVPLRLPGPDDPRRVRAPDRGAHRLLHRREPAGVHAAVQNLGLVVRRAGTRLPAADHGVRRGRIPHVSAFAPRPRTLVDARLRRVPARHHAARAGVEGRAAAGPAVLGFACILDERRWVRLLALLALFGAIAIRYNAFAAAFPIVVFLFEWRAGLHWIKRYAIALAAWIAITFAASRPTRCSPIARCTCGTRRSRCSTSRARSRTRARSPTPSSRR